MNFLEGGIFVPKYIVDETKIMWEHNDNCSLCSAIDKQYNYIEEIFKTPNYDKDYLQQQWNVLEDMLVNGYGELHTLEAESKVHKFYNNLLNDMTFYNEDINKLIINKYGNKKIKYNEDNLRQASVLFSRFCRNCGSRKPDIVNTHQLLQFEYDLKATINADCHSATISWNPIDYPFDFTVKLYKRADNTQIDTIKDKDNNDVPDLSKGKFILQNDEKIWYRYVDTFHNNDILSYNDTMIADGRAYYYALEYYDVDNMNFQTIFAHTYNKTWFDHIPKLLKNLKYKQHRHLIKDSTGKLVTDDFIYAYYEDNNDMDFGDVFFKLNSDHVPSLDYFITDYQFQNHEKFHLPDNNTSYFIKPYIRSKLFKKDWDNDHQIYPDLYFWNTDSQAELIHYKPYYDEMYNLKFEDGICSMKISYDLKIRNHIDHIRIMFKQDNQYITDDDDGTYKIVDVPAIHAAYHYEINITGLASNTYWVFGVFPVYIDTDADIRTEYQTIVKIKPWFVKDEYFSDEFDFTYIGKWYLNHDFDDYALPSLNHVVKANAKKKEVWMVDKQQKKDVAPLVILRETVPEYFYIEFDYKTVTKTDLDRYHYYINDKRQLKIVDTEDKWLHYKEYFYNLNYAIHRWEQMKMSDSPWTCSFVDNIHIHNFTVIDKETKNFTRKDELKYTNYHYYDRKIKHNGLFQHTPDKFYGVDIQINPYNKDYIDMNHNGIDDIDECETIGKPNENFDWMP